jgi:hypothetical protein
MGHIVRLHHDMARFGLVLLFAFRVIATASTPAEQDVITGCLPLTIDDTARFDPPTFEEYPVLEEFQGPRSPPDIASHSLARQFRTMLRKGATEGPNFAGHYTITSWGCGSACVQFAIIDARNGRVFFPPEVLHVSMLHVMEPEDASHRQLARPRFRRDSALFIVVGAVSEGEDEGISYYLWTGAKLTRVRFVRSEKIGCPPLPALFLTTSGGSARRPRPLRESHSGP